MKKQTQAEIGKIRALVDAAPPDCPSKIELNAQKNALEKRMVLESSMRTIRSSCNLFFFLYFLVPVSFAYYYFKISPTFDWPAAYIARDVLFFLITLVLHRTIAARGVKIAKDLDRMFPYPTPPPSSSSS